MNGAAPMLPGFELCEQLGAGAWGEVWRAIEHVSGRTVAIKFLAPALTLASGDADRAAKLAWRFQREIEAAAAQDHPHIAHVYASGVADGRPWFAMELVEGVPLDDFAAALPLPERLALFQKVCAGVQHAHDGGVIHRDLKPANILVRADGTPKILDFGLARFLDDSGLGATLSLDGQTLGTPMFMAPEQAAGKLSEIGVGADVYALGVVLYRLITGAWPFDEKLPPLQLLTAARDTEPVPPRTVKPDISRDLDAIILKALAKQRGERYPSVRALADDAGRFLDREPVRARAWTFRYVIRKRLRKHWRGFAVTTVVLMLLVALLAVRLDQRRRIAEQNARALDQSRELVNAMLFDLHGKLEAAGRPDLFAGIAAQAQKFPWRVDASAIGSLDLRRSQALAATARGDRLLAELNPSKALEAYREAAAQLTALAAEHLDQPRLQLDAAGAQLTVHTTLLKLARHGEALTGLRTLLARLEPMQNPGTAAEIQQLRAQAHRAAGGALRAKNRLPEAEVELEKALTLVAPSADLFAGLNEDLGSVCRARGELEKSLAAYNKAEAQRRRAHAEAPRAGVNSINLSRCLTAKSAALCEANRLGEARRCLDEARDLCKDPGEQAPPSSIIQHARVLAAGYHQLSKSLVSTGDDAAALEADREALQILQTLFRQQNRHVSERVAICEVQRHMGEILLRLGQPGDGGRILRQALEKARQLSQGGHPDAARWLLATAELEIRLIATDLPALGKFSQQALSSTATEHLDQFDRLKNTTEAQREVARALRARLPQKPAQQPSSSAP